MANEFKIRKGLIVEGASGGTVVDVQGSQGQLFSVTDNLSGSIFAVSDISGVPILDVNSSGVSYFDGSLGIGTDNPARQLEVVSSSGIVTVLTSTIGGSYISMEDSTTTSDSQVRFGAIGNNAVIKSGGATALTLDTSQNATFEGSVKATQLEIESAVPSILFDETDVTANWRNRVQSGGYRIQYASNGITFVDHLTLGANANTVAKDTTFGEQAFATTATSSGDASSTLTTKGYVDSLITGATIYRGTWDPDVSLNSGYGNPNLNTVTQTSGYYYICSADGTATPNGTGNEPNTWSTGDWVIWNDDIGASGEWQKVDNSSVLSGVGTGQTVALWEGAGSVTDSETLGNAPITVSGNDTTFVGDVRADTHFNSSDTNVVLSTNSDGTVFLRPNGKSSGTAQSTFTTSLASIGTDATFAGDVTLTNGQLTVTHDVNNVAKIIQADTNLGNNSYTFEVDSSSQVSNMSAAGAMSVDVNSGRAFTITGQGNVGIGTISPSQKTVISGPNTAPSLNTTAVSSASLLVSNSDTGYGTYFGSTPAGIGLIQQRRQTSAVYYGLSLQPYGGNVGIGTTNPGSILSLRKDDSVLYDPTSDDGQRAVGPTILLNNNNTTTNTFGQIMYDTDSSGQGVARIVFLDAGTASSAIAFVTEEADSIDERMRIAADGNVGIGTDDPGQNLEISGEGNVAIRLTSTNNVSSTLQFADSDDANVGLIQYTHSNNSMSFKTNDVERMYINSSGNVGIGTTTPNNFGFLEKALHINAGTSSDTTLKQTGLVISGSSDANDADDFAYVSFLNNHSTLSNDRVAEIRVLKNGTNVNTGEFAFFTANGTGLNEAMRIDASANVGIGTINPGTRLDVQGASTSGIVDVASFVNPVNAAGTGHGARIILHSTTDTGRGVAIASSSESNYAVDNAMVFYTGLSSTLTERMRITSAGNVGINVTNPGHKLHINNGSGTSFTQAIKISNSVGVGGGPAIFFKTSGADADNRYGVKLGGIRSDSDNGSSIFIIQQELDNGSGALLGLQDTFRINQYGDVGIGTTSPGNKLAVQSFFTTSASNSFVEINSGHEASGGSDLTGEAGLLFKQAGSGNVLRDAGSIVSGRESNYSTDNTADSYLTFSTAQNNVNAERMRINSSGNVGIGTTTVAAGYKLQVEGAIFTNGGKVSIGLDGTAAEPSLIVNDGDSGFFRPSSNTIGISTAGSERMRLTSAGEVLVGVTSNQTESKLTSRQNGSSIEFGHLNQSSGYYGTLGAMYSSGRPFLAFSCDSSPTSAGNNFATRGFKGNVIFSETNGNLKFAQATNANSTSQALTERMAIKNDGAVQFNAYDSTNKTGTPTYLLGTDASGNIVKTNTVPGSGAGPYLPLSAGSSYPLTNSLYIGSSGANGLILKQDTSAASNSGRLFFQNDTAIEGVCIMNANGRLDFRTSSDPGVTSGNIKMVLTNAGNVGIGTTSPSDKLDVAGAIRLTSNISFSSSLAGRIYKSSQHGLAFQGVAGSANNFALFTPAGQLKIVNPVGTNDVSINPVSGNVGIGTTTPSAKLDIQGTQGQLFSVTDDLSGEIFAVADISGVPIMTVNSSGVSYFDGNVGIGTDSPQATTGIKLDVIGGIGAWASNNTSTLKLFNGRLVGAGRQIANLVSYNGNGALDLYDGANTLKIHLQGSGSSYLNGGNVGIGTSSPGAKLEVVTARTGTPSTDTNIKVTDDTAQAADVGGSINFTGKYTNSGTVLSGSPFIRASKKNGNDSDYGFGLKFGVRASSSATNNVAMTIDSNSNVGIGTTDPVAMLQAGSFAVQGAPCYGVGIGLTNTELGSDLQSLLTVKGNISYGYNNYNSVANTWSNALNFSGYPAGLYQVNICKQSNASAYIIAQVKWSGTAGTVINTVTSFQYGITFSGTQLQSIINTTTDTSISVQCLVTFESCLP